MTDALVEDDPGRIHPDDMAVILDALDAIDVSAKPVRTVTPDNPDDWTLCLHWLQHGPVSSDTEAALPGVLLRIRDHYTVNGRTPPTRMDLHGPDGGELLTVEGGQSHPS